MVSDPCVQLFSFHRQTHRHTLHTVTTTCAFTNIGHTTDIILTHLSVCTRLTDKGKQSRTHHRYW